MERLLDSPNLPEGRVSAVIIGEVYAPLFTPALEAMEIKVIKCPPNPVLDPRLSCHADLSLLHLGGRDILVSRHVADNRFLSELTELGLCPTLTDVPFGPDYPGDAVLCAAIMGERVFHDPRILLPELGGRELISVRQGYAKCSICPVTGDSLISSDPGVTKAARAAGLRTLEISPGHIALPGHPNGFIGGAAFKPGPGTLALTGRISLHPDRGRLESFLREQGITPAYLTDAPALDVGSIIPVVQKTGSVAVTEHGAGIIR